MLCMHCGHKNAEDANFCWKCGTLLEKQDGESVPPMGYDIVASPETAQFQMPKISWLESYIDMMYYRAFSFKGRTTVAGFWKAFIINAILTVGLACVAGELYVSPDGVPPMVTMLSLFFIPIYGSYIIMQSPTWYAFLPFGLFLLFQLIPLLAMGVRRLHDSNKAGWFLLLNLNVVGQLALLVVMFFNGTPGRNAFGPVPEKRFVSEMGKYALVKAALPAIISYGLAIILLVTR